MKIGKLIVLILGVARIALVPMLAGGEIGVSINVPAPVVTIPAPVVVVPAPVVTVGVPESYVYDGTEYVGMVGSQYYYLGPDNVWLAMDGPHLNRWNGWAHEHPDWHSRMVHNDRYRNAPAHASAVHDDHYNRDAHDVRPAREVHDSHVDDHAGHDHDDHH